MNRLWIVAAIAATVAGCATTKELVPIGGSRADGTVQMAYEYMNYERPEVDAEAARVSARQRCQAWGYKDAEAFGGAMTQCLQSNNYGCAQTRVTVTYQCTGANGPS